MRAATNPSNSAPVQVVSDAALPSASVIEVVLTSGARVVIREGTSEQLVRQVVSALRALC